MKWIHSSIPYPALSAIPLEISLLGQLITTAWSVEDISIDYPPKNKKFKRIKYPDSLRTSLWQISNDCSEAFKTAQDGMARIESSCEDFGKNLTEIETIMKKETANNLLQLTKIANMKITKGSELFTRDCTHESDKIVKSFENVHELLKEVQMACSYYNKKNEAEKLNDRMQLKLVEENKDQKDKEEEAILQRKKETEEAAKKAIEKLPTNLQLCGLEALEMFFMTSKEIVSNMTFGIADLLPYILKKLKKKKSTADKKTLTEKFISFELEMIKQIELEADRKLQKVKIEKEELREQFDQLTNQLLSKPEIDTTLRNCIFYIGKLLDHWRQLHDFFSRMKINTEIIEKKISSLISDLHYAVQSTETADLMKETIQNGIFETRRMTRTIGLFSGWYFKISDEHMMPTINSLNANSVVITPENREAEIEKFKVSATEALNAIGAIKAEEL